MTVSHNATAVFASGYTSLSFSTLWTLEVVSF